MVQSTKLRDALVVWIEASEEPHQFNIAAALRFQASGRADLVQVPIKVELKQIAGIVTRSPYLGSLRTLKAKLRHWQRSNKCVNHPT
jgi:hypothetical protein